jgi:hypothetical protein
MRFIFDFHVPLVFISESYLGSGLTLERRYFVIDIAELFSTLEIADSLNKTSAVVEVKLRIGTIADSRGMSTSRVISCVKLSHRPRVARPTACPGYSPLVAMFMLFTV